MSDLRKHYDYYTILFFVTVPISQVNIKISSRAYMIFSQSSLNQGFTVLWNVLPKRNANSLFTLMPGNAESRNKYVDSLPPLTALHPTAPCLDVLFPVISDIAAQHLFYVKALLQTLHCQFNLSKVGGNTF